MIMHGTADDNVHYQSFERLTNELIKHNKVFKDTPVIMLSSKDGLFDRARGRLVGSEQYLTKPFTKDELLGAIQSQVSG